MGSSARSLFALGAVLSELASRGGPEVIGCCCKSRVTSSLIGCCCEMLDEPPATTLPKRQRQIGNDAADVTPQRLNSRSPHVDAATLQLPATEGQVGYSW